MSAFTSVARPLIETWVPPDDIERGDGDRVRRFTETLCHLTKDGRAARAGSLIRLRPWQYERAGRIYARRADGRYRHREALLGLPRKNSKSALGSSFGLYGLIFGGEGSEVYSCAADKDQARIVFGVAKRMVEIEPQLSDYVTIYRDALEVKETGSIYRVLSSEAFSKEGLNPTVVIYDELHAAPNDELYSVMSLGSGTRLDPLLISITTAGKMSDSTGQDSICYRRYQYGAQVASGEVDDPSFYFCWYGAPDGAKYTDEEVWAAANPAYGDFLDPEDFRHAIGSVHENDFRTKRLNQWVSATQVWLPEEAWRACQFRGQFLEPDKGVVLGFDGSRSGDSTALVAVTVEKEPKVQVIGIWEKPRDAREWQVPRGEVKDAIRKACRDYTVREIAADEYLWLDSLEELADEGLPVVAFPQTLSRLSPATQRFYEMVMARTIRHFGDPGLTRHIANAQIKAETRGSRIVKDAQNSPRKIDAAVAAVMAVDRAGWYLTAKQDELPENDPLRWGNNRDGGYVW